MDISRRRVFVTVCTLCFRRVVENHTGTYHSPYTRIAHSPRRVVSTIEYRIDYPMLACGWRMVVSFISGTQKRDSRASSFTRSLVLRLDLNDTPKRLRNVSYVDTIRYSSWRGRAKGEGQAASSFTSRKSQHLVTPRRIRSMTRRDGLAGRTIEKQQTRHRQQARHRRGEGRRS